MMKVDKILITRRGNTCVYFRTYKFGKVREFVNGTVKFACTQKKCSAIIHTTCDFKQVTEIKNDHSHAAYTAEQAQMDVLVKILCRNLLNRDLTVPVFVADFEICI